MNSLLNIFQNSGHFSELKQIIENRETTDIYGITPSFKPYLMAGMTRMGRSMLWVISSWNSCEKMFESAYPYFPEDIRDRLVVFPEFREAGDQDLTPALRMKVLKMLTDGKPIYMIAPFKALLQNCEDTAILKSDSLWFETGAEMSLDETVDKLDNLGYRRNFQVECRGEYSRRGGILDIYPSTTDPVRVEFFGDEIDSIRTFDLDTQVSTGKLNSILIYPKREYKREKKLLGILPEGSITVIDDPAVIKFHAVEREVNEERDFWEEFQNEIAGTNTVNIASWEGEDKSKGIHFDTKPLDTFGGNIEKFIDQLEKWQKLDEKLLVSTQQSERFKNLFADMKISGAHFGMPQEIKSGEMVIIPGDLGVGFFWSEASLRVVGDKDILGAAPRKKRVLRTWDRSKAVNLADLKPGDRVVHISHGIGVFNQLVHLVVEGTAKDFVEIQYHKGDKLFVPIQQLDLLQKFVGPDGGSSLNLSKLGGSDWIKTRKKVKASAEAIADDLIKLYAGREQSQGFAYAADNRWQWELEASFPFEETPDQDKVIAEVKKDMELPRPMDRLLCGDAGYGKTEVALRAAFKAAQDGKQIAVLVPTTILAAQHYETFKNRLAPFPINVEMLSRFRTAKEKKQIVQKLETGEIDIVVGTHSLLRKGMKYKNLGLLVIDEEQHFGVMQKERIKQLKNSVDVLTMTATPIPRTLHLSMSGIRDISVIETPPEERLPVKTVLAEYNPELIRAAIIRELERGGQVYFVHNKVHNIERFAQEIRRLVPYARVAVGHGQMDEDALELLMLDFIEGSFDVLVCTTIIESGIDVSNVNTIIINDAQNFGLASLYQLRGRVGRSNHQAYAYLIYPPHLKLTDEAQQRLEVIRDFTHFGAGFQIAMKDLEIRGAGNLLGAEQSGCIASVGFDLYCQLLKEAVDERRGVTSERRAESPVVDLPVNAFIPDSYIPNSGIKMEMYRKISKLEKIEDMGSLIDEFRDRFGALPKELLNLMEILKIKLLAWDLDSPYVKELKGQVHILLPGVSAINLRVLQDVYDKTKVVPRFERSLLMLQNIFKTDKKSLVPKVDYGKPDEWMPKILNVLEYLVHLRKEKVI
ncbi:MAG: transcription-repair coupling factor [Firmicutes bacterium]|nr:transcription-repair coupling factor [Bacillota bacterium]